MSKIKIQLQLSEADKKELNYDTPIVTWDFEKLMKRNFSLPITNDFRDELIKAIREDLHIPEGYLEEYQATFKEGVILVL